MQMEIFLYLNGKEKILKLIDLDILNPFYSSF